MSLRTLALVCLERLCKDKNSPEGLLADLGETSSHHFLPKGGGLIIWMDLLCYTRKQLPKNTLSLMGSQEEKRKRIGHGEELTNAFL